MNPHSPLCRTLIPLALLAALAVPAGADERPAAPATPKVESLWLHVAGVGTREIQIATYRALVAVPGVQSLRWTAPRTELKVVRLVGQAPTPKLVAAAAGAGATATALVTARQRLVFRERLHCNGCVIRVKRALKAVAGTKEVHVAEDRTCVTVVYDTKAAKVAELEKALAEAGYPVK